MMFLSTFLFLTLLTSELCGSPLLVENETEEFGRIINGRNAEEGEIEYQVSLQYRGSSFPFCGGTRIDENWIVTAAHCARNQHAENLKVVAGALNLQDQNNPVYRVTKIIAHPYNDATKIGDVALFKVEAEDLHEEYRSSHPMSNMALHLDSTKETDKPCNVSGWGHTKEDSHQAPHILQVVSVDIVSPNLCSQMLSGGLPWDADAMVCAGGRDKDACQGDSGGPLVCSDADDKAYLKGIVSWGVGCATEGIPGVYTNVLTYSPWIQETIKENS